MDIMSLLLGQVSTAAQRLNAAPKVPQLLDDCAESV